MGGSHKPETQRLLRPRSQLLTIKHERLSRRTGERRPNRSERRLGRRPDRPFRCEHPTARRRSRHRTMPQCRAAGKPYFWPATLLGWSEAMGYQMVVSLVGPRDPPDREARTSLVSDVDLLGRFQDAREERFHGEDHTSRRPEPLDPAARS
jgi:hypothetical protein